MTKPPEKVYAAGVPSDLWFRLFVARQIGSPFWDINSSVRLAQQADAAQKKGRTVVSPAQVGSVQNSGLMDYMHWPIV